MRQITLLLLLVTQKINNRVTVIMIYVINSDLDNVQHLLTII